MILYAFFLRGAIIVYVWSMANLLYFCPKDEGELETIICVGVTITWIYLKCLLRLECKLIWSLRAYDEDKLYKQPK